MVAGYTVAQLRAAEAPHLQRGEPLMRRAAAALADSVRELAPETVARVVLLVGTGDNGGDALHAGAELAAAGHPVVVVPTGARMHEEGRRLAEAAGAAFVDGADDDAVRAAAVSAEVIVDGIVGIGTSADPALRGRAREIVLLVREVAGDAVVVAADLPSGIHPELGTVPDRDAVLPARRTVTFGAATAGLLLAPATDYVGELRVVDLGLGPELARFEPVVERD